MRCNSLIHTPFFFHDPATSEIYTLSLHDALPICSLEPPFDSKLLQDTSVKGTKAEQTSTTVLNARSRNRNQQDGGDRKSTRLNSSHVAISYAVFCLKKKTTNKLYTTRKKTDR